MPGGRFLQPSFAPTLEPRHHGEGAQFRRRVGEMEDARSGNLE